MCKAEPLPAPLVVRKSALLPPLRDLQGVRIGAAVSPVGLRSILN